MDLILEDVFPIETPGFSSKQLCLPEGGGFMVRPALKKICRPGKAPCNSLKRLGMESHAVLNQKIAWGIGFTLLEVHI